MQRIFYLMQKEFRQIRREKIYMAIIFVMPVVQLLLLGYAITTDIKNVEVMLVDQDHSRESREVAYTLDRSDWFDLRGVTGGIDEAIAALDKGEVRTALVLPPGFSEGLYNGEPRDVQVLVDGVDGNAAGIVQAYVRGQIASLIRAWLTDAATSPLVEHAGTLSVEPRFWYNETLESRSNIVPGILALLLTLVTLFLTSMNLVREREVGTLEQLMVTPIRKLELILGKVLPFVIMGLILISIGMLGIRFVFGVRMAGNLITIYGMALLFMLTNLGIGIFISTIASTQQQAMFFAWFMMIFMILLSGFFIPIENMPDWVQALTRINPLRYFMDSVRGIYLKGTGFADLTSEIRSMLIIGFTTLLMAILRFRKRLS